MQSSWSGHCCPWRTWWCTSQLTWAGAGLCCVGLQVQRGLQAGLCCTNSWPQDKLSQLVVTEEPAGSPHLLSTSDYATCTASPLSNCAAGSSYVNIHSVWQYQWRTESFSLRNLYITARMTKTEDNSLWMGSVQCTVGKSICGLSDAACMQSAQHLKGRKIYLLSIFLFLFYLI